MGPWIVTADELAFPPIVGVCSRVNGGVRQKSSTSKLIFDVAYIVNDLSQGMTLKAGTIISTGTPGGVGAGFKPPRFLKSGDVVECEIDKIAVCHTY
jgi:2-keto-4-pentenoate hydratase/2-oxohepta-3-ene-1,7-dioic acid hydratase in catechol pathway